MPIVNGAYDAPTWNNNAPPAIDASELQDMCDTIETYGTQKADVDYVNTFVRPNLLDNWYFVGGGSQSTTGAFPINQRGKSSYTGLGYSVDRWNVANTTITVTLGSDGLVMTSSSGMPSGYRLLEQYLEDGPKAGETYTISMLTSACSGTFSLNFGSKGTSANRIRSGDFSSAGLVSVTGTFSSDCSDPFFGIGSRVSGVTSLTIVAVKVERGATQTLAHPDGNGGWVLNEVPNFEEQLARCQRFCYVWNTGGSEYASIGVGYTTSATEARVVFPFPVTMRTNPTLTTTGSFSVGVGSNVYAASSVAKEPTWSNTDGARINVTLSSSATSGSPCIVRGNGSTAKLNFSADL